MTRRRRPINRAMERVQTRKSMQEVQAVAGALARSIDGIVERYGLPLEEVHQILMSNGLERPTP